MDEHWPIVLHNKSAIWKLFEADWMQAFRPFFKALTMECCVQFNRFEAA
jgi:hypothetical protein